MTTPKFSHSNLNKDHRPELPAQTPRDVELGPLGTLEKTAATLLEGVICLITIRGPNGCRKCNGLDLLL